MRFLPISDLHFEFHKDGGKAFVDLLPDDVDVVILAGDIAVGEGIPAALDLFCNKYEKVVYLHGNHEFYGSTRARVHELTAAAMHRHENLYWLKGNQIYIKNDASDSLNERILGCPLWFPRPLLTQDKYESAKKRMSDFTSIKDFEEWVYTDNEEQVRFLEDYLQEGDIVVTHYLPSFSSVALEWKGSLLNSFFVCDLEKLILKKKPKLWIHGHTHGSCDYMLGSTRVVCNPFGYAGYDENRWFKPELVIDIR